MALISWDAVCIDLIGSYTGTEQKGNDRIINAMIGRLVVYSIGVIMRLIFNRSDFYLILMSVPLIRIIILVDASQLI